MCSPQWYRELLQAASCLGVRVDMRVQPLELLISFPACMWVLHWELWGQPLALFLYRAACMEGQGQVWLAGTPRELHLPINHQFDPDCGRGPGWRLSEMRG